MMNDLIALSQDSETASAFESRVLLLLERELGFDAAFFLVPGQPPVTSGFDPASSALLQSRCSVYAEELLPVKRAALASRGVAVDTTVCGVRKVRKTRYFREITRKLGGSHSLMAYVPWNGSIVAAVMLGRVSTFTDSELQRMETLLPTLGVARAAFGIPHVATPLPTCAAPRSWLGLGRQSPVLATRATEMGEVIVRDSGGFREMVARNAGKELVWTRSALGDASRSGWPYVELFHIAAAVARHRRRVLFIGSGGAVSLHQFATVYPGICIDLVERDPAVIHLAQKWFALGTIPRLTVNVADGESFLRNAAHRTWDIVVVDAYDASDPCPVFLQGKLLQVLRDCLEPGGAVAFNVIGALGGEGAVASMVAAARAAFDAVRIVPVIDPDEVYAEATTRNVVIVASRNN